ncbi:MAG: FAD-dependent oxidoreductase [Planctomycetes bacterium]|nr:FAD-dependent oxidoreductase [Planctomycetota bacterium]MCH9725690.1 FAD-dependent oxidoreductase [Planctomycetota bacterium]MCH9777745.1 FAD-dependent oxidoreductase [Planctomycetota bacterium]MCH9791197.1 FAD-dependent oxidoreductase [Planctomycetota bacterium]
MPRVDLIIFGGGIAGLWTLSEASRRGYRCLLLEAFELGSGQTIASQGIIHGGLKYTLQGMLTGSAQRIREMPLIWKNCLSGEQRPDLSQTEIRSNCCYLWRTDSLSSRLGMFGAKMGLHVVPKKLAKEETPEVLANCPGSIAIMDEQVISPQSLIVNLADSFQDQIIKYEPKDLSFTWNQNEHITSVQIQKPNGEFFSIKTAAVLLTAGSGNETLRNQARQQSSPFQIPFMQKRPLHMAMVRGALPQFNGHCVDGAKTRITITSDTNSLGNTVWQLGGQVAEIGVDMNRGELIRHAARELAASVPGIDLSELEWNTYRVDRAEGATKTGVRPETAQVLKEGNLFTAWPSKLALAPRLATEVCDHLQQINVPPAQDDTSWKEVLSTLPRPQVALPPWETAEDWVRLDRLSALDGAA